ncbi:MAG: PA0069 family radical SAM protein [Rhodothermales bacterium]
MTSNPGDASHPTDPNPAPVARRGRGAALNPATRFDPVHFLEDPAELSAEELRQVHTEFIRDSSRSILAKNDSPDLPFTFSLNPYRGCEHGCIYCYARPSHEYLGYSAGLDFETKIVVKYDAPSLLAAQLKKKSWVPQLVLVSGNTDPYQPAERRLGLTRRCLEVFRDFGNPVCIITKNHLVTRDLDILSDLARDNLVHVTMSITSLKDEVIRVMEPRTSRPEARLRAVEMLASRGISVGVNIAPIIPGLTDEEMPEIMRRAAAAGARTANYIVVRLPGPVKELFLEWVERCFPNRVNRIVHRIEDLRSGNLNDPRWGVRMRGEGQWAELFSDLFHRVREKLGLNTDIVPLSTNHFRIPAPLTDLPLFSQPDAQ